MITRISSLPSGLWGLILIIFFSCKSKDFQATSRPSRSPSDPKTTLSAQQRIIEFRPSDKSLYKYNVTSSTIIEQEINGDEVSSEMKTELSTDYSISTDSANNSKITITYNNFKAEASVGDQKQEIDASLASNSLNPQERIFGAFDNASISVTIDSNGTVSEVHGADQIQTRMYDLSRGDQQAIQTIKKTVEQYLTKESLKNNLGQQFKIVPNKGIQVGDTWVNNTKIGADVEATTPIAYKFVSIEDGMGIIEFESDFNLIDQPYNKDNNTRVSLKGHQKGTAKVEMTTGIVLHSTSSIKAKGNIISLGLATPISLELKTSIEGKRVK